MLFRNDSSEKSGMLDLSRRAEQVAQAMAQDIFGKEATVTIPTPSGSDHIRVPSGCASQGWPQSYTDSVRRDHRDRAVAQLTALRQAALKKATAIRGVETQSCAS